MGNREPDEKHEKEPPMGADGRGLGFAGLVELFEQTQTAMQRQAARSVDIALVVRNWLFGWYIVEFEDGGAERAELYGKELIKRLSEELKTLGMRGMSQTNLRKFREFYLAYRKIQQALPVTSRPDKTGEKKIQQERWPRLFGQVGGERAKKAEAVPRDGFVTPATPATANCSPSW